MRPSGSGDCAKKSACSSKRQQRSGYISSGSGGFRLCAGLSWHHTAPCSHTGCRRPDAGGMASATALNPMCSAALVNSSARLKRAPRPSCVPSACTRTGQRPPASKSCSRVRSPSSCDGDCGMSVAAMDSQRALAKRFTQVDPATPAACRPSRPTSSSFAMTLAVSTRSAPADEFSNCMQGASRKLQSIARAGSPAAPAQPSPVAQLPSAAGTASAAAAAERNTSGATAPHGRNRHRCGASDMTPHHPHQKR
mmetsp:Transcript_23196/g.69471  ORF Transcript_23196/g.69471 Transcript_23196/m.69471 type:complete len:252 (-) Transcript_23196:6-761(-)